MRSTVIRGFLARCAWLGLFALAAGLVVLCTLPRSAHTARADTTGGSGDYSLKVTTCSAAQDPNGGTVDSVSATLQARGDVRLRQPPTSFTLRLDNPGTDRAPGSVDTYRFAWAAERDVRALQSLQLHKLDDGDSWCLTDVVLSWRSTELFRWNSSAQQPAGNYVVEHPTRGVIRLDSARPSIRFTETTEADVSSSGTMDAHRKLFLEADTCSGQAGGTINRVVVAVEHDSLIDAVELPGSSFPAGEAAMLFDFASIAYVGDLTKLRISKPAGSDDLCVDNLRILRDNGPRAAATVIWQDTTTRTVGTGTAGAITYDVNTSVFSCACIPLVNPQSDQSLRTSIVPTACGDTCLGTKRQGFFLSLNDVNANCAAGFAPPSSNDAVCDQADTDCSGTADEDYVPLYCGVGACERNSTCNNGVVVPCSPGTPGPSDIPGNSRDDDCDGLRDEVNPGGACTADSQCDRGVPCHLGFCLLPHCANGVLDRDENEQGVDCGGTDCKPCDGRSCADPCRVGEQTTPPAEDSLRFSLGTFTRNSEATYEGASAKLETAQANQLRWVDVRGRRLALFEGATQNFAAHSGAVDTAPSWMRPDSPAMTVVSNAERAPDGTMNAERLMSAGQPSRGPTQTLRYGPSGRSTMSLYASGLLGELEEPVPLRAVVRAGGTSPTTYAGNWSVLGRGWNRYALSYDHSSDRPVTFGVSHAADSTPALPAVPPLDLAVWGVQMEVGAFPTSLIPTKDFTGYREADKLLIARASVPDWIGTGMWQIDVAPLYASDEMYEGRSYTIMSWTHGAHISFANSVPSGRARLVVKLASLTWSSPELTWSRGAVLRITIDNAGDRITISGTESGDSTYPVPSLQFAASNIYVGSRSADGQEAFAALSEPRRVTGITAVCEATPDCSCGDGELQPGEACDPALVTCADDCSNVAVVTCDEDADCPNGESCGKQNGAAFDLASFVNVCWPDFCTDAASENCGEGAACGDCLCTYDCSAATCGATTDDGCGALCSGTCGEGESGGLTDADCGFGLALGEGEGASFGHATGTNVCWPVLCEDAIFRRAHCGADGLCGLCPEEPNECGSQQCGRDQYGRSCGTCSTGRICDEARGACIEEVPTTQPLPSRPEIADVLNSPPADAAGTIPGTFAATDEGTATYVIPLDVPPGRAGMTPQLALSYGSSSGDGYVGRGWSLSGLSAITRCPRTFAQHGYAAGVDLTPEDALCIDGQLLVRNAEGEYRTEVDSFMRVRSFGADFTAPVNGRANYTGPSHFQVWTKDGKVLTYGQSVKARVRAIFDGEPYYSKTSPVNVSWLLQSVSDLSGNEIKVHYSPETHDRNGFKYTSEVRPTLITYGPSESHSVVIRYDDNKNNSSVRSYRAGVGRHFSSPISGVLMHVDGKEAHRYELDSEMDGDQWMLREVRHCASTSAGERCLPPTTLGYTEGGRSITKIATTTDEAGHVPITPNYRGRLKDTFEPDNFNNWQLAAIDHDGDGRDDLLHSKFEGRGAYLERIQDKPDPTKLYLRRSRPLANGSVFAELGPTTRQNCLLVTPVDFNDDGRGDFVGRCATSGWQEKFETRLITSTEEGFSSRTVAGLVGAAPPGMQREDDFHALDLDGDGQLDFVGCASRDGEGDDSELLFYQNSSGQFALRDRIELDGLSGDKVSCKSAMFVVDYDGDGRGNLLAFDSEADGNHSNDKTSRAFALGFRAGELVMKPLGVQPFAPVLYAYLNGNEYSSWVEYRKDFDFRPLDANGDGLQDVVHRYRKERPKLYLSTGRGFVYAGTAPGTAADYTIYEHSFVFDHDSDGKDELLVPVIGQGWRVHTPYSQSEAGTSWKVSDTRLPFVAARMRYDEKTRIRYSFQRPFPLDWDGDGVMELVTRNTPEARPDDVTHPVLELYKAGPRTQRLLTSITDGLGKRIDVTYDGAPASYAAGQCRYPQRCLKTLPMPVVTSHTESGSAGGFADGRGRSSASIVRTYEYKYADARVDMRGRGLLGFGRRWVREFGSPGTLIRETEYEYDHSTVTADSKMYPFAHAVKTVTARIPSSGNMLNGPTSRSNITTITNTWLVKTSADSRPYVVLDSRRTDYVEGSGTAPASVGYKTESFGYDGYGNATFAGTIWNDGHSLSTTTEYIGSTDGGQWSAFKEKWLVGLIKKQTVVSSRGGETKSYRLKLFYDGPAGHRGLQDRIERWSMNGEQERSLEQRTTLGYDRYGNEKSRTLWGRDAVEQGTSIKFDERGLFPIELHNSVHDAANLGPTKIGVDARSGEVQWKEEPDGSWNVSNRDAFGRVVETADATGRRTYTSYAMADESGAKLSVSVRGPGRPTVETRYNAFGAVTRTLSTEWAVHAGRAQTTMVETGYDDQGRKVAEGVPHLVGTGSPAAHQLYYDGLDRLIKEEHPLRTPEGALTYSTTTHLWGSKAYAGTAGDPVPWSTLPSAAWAHEVEDQASGAWRVEVTDVEGKPVAAIDALQSVTRLTYGAFDRLREVSAPGAITTYLGDELGRTTHVTDPNIGDVDYVYDGLGMLKTETRNGVLRSTTQYDGLGRAVSADTSDGHYEWHYDGTGETTSLIGHLELETLTSSTIGNTSARYEYDSPGAILSAIRRTIDGESFDTVIEPADLGRPGVIQYPVPGDRSFAVRFQYEPNHGRLNAVEEADTGTKLWQLDEIDAFGNASRVSYANGHTVRRAYEPTTGRLSNTQVLNPNGSSVTEQRLTYESRGFVKTRTTVESGAAAVESFDYDTLGRLIVHQKPGATGSYRYDVNGNIKSTPTQISMRYDEAGPHQLTSTGDARSFKYEDGNQTLRTGNGVVGRRQKITYSAFDLPTQVLVGPDGSPTDQVNYHYDSSNSRVSQQWSDGSKVVYAGDLYQRATAPEQEDEHIVRIPTPDGFEIEARLSAGTEREFRFLHTDFLGSVLGVNDESRTRVDIRTYTPFGRMTQSGSVKSRAGFTGHEMDTRLGLVNMRGRMYDPDLGRFLSSDPVVQDSLNSQNWNRYSYVLNNPLNLVDPNGFEAEGASGGSDASTAGGVTIRVCYTPDGSCGGPPVEAGPLAAESAPVAEPGEGGGGAGVGAAGGSAEPTPAAADIVPEEVPVGATEVAGVGTAIAAFATGAVQGAATTALISYGLGYAAGVASGVATAAGMAGAASVAPAVIFVGGVALAAWGVYELANGGAQQLVDTASNFANWRATEKDWHIAGGFFGSMLSGFRAQRFVEGGMQHGLHDMATAGRVGIMPNGGFARPHGSPRHNSSIDAEIATLRTDPRVSNIRKNQQQVDVAGKNVGKNRPDIQYDKNGVHHNHEIDTTPGGSARHQVQLPQNDPNAVHIFDLI